MLWHMGRAAEWMNPKLMGCCLADEDYVGRIAGMVKGIMQARKALDLPTAIMQQYVKGVSCALVSINVLNRWSRMARP